MTRLPDGLTERLNPPKFFAVRPGSMTERPIGAAIMGADALSDVLRAVRLSSAMFFHLDVRAPWVAAAPASSACASAVLPGAQHVIEYHVVIDGCCWGGLIGEPSVRLDAGDIIAFPQGAAHVLSSAPGMQAIPDLSYYHQPTADQLPHMIRLGDNGPADARILCGFLGCDKRPFNPLLEVVARGLALAAKFISREFRTCFPDRCCKGRNGRTPDRWRRRPCPAGRAAVRRGDQVSYRRAGPRTDGLACRPGRSTCRSGAEPPAWRSRGGLDTG